jgi:hypothetical protein
MNIEAATMDVPYGAAISAYRNYRQAIKENRATKDDILIARAYHALLRGRKVIDAEKAIVDAGRYPVGHRWQAMPKLAIARADWPHVQAGYTHHPTRNRVIRFQRERWSRGNALKIDVPVSQFRDGLTWDQLNVSDRRALVPSIPPQFRPADSLHNYFILFEADWSSAPVDPLLLKHLGGVFYVVLAAWDLTPIEQAVLRQRL